MKVLRYIIHHSFHDDVEYIFNYCLPVETSTNIRHLTVLIGFNKLFHFSTRSGFTAFFKCAKDYAPSFAVFAGEVHNINTGDEPLSATLLSSGKSREYFNPSHTISSDITREIPYDKTREPSSADDFDHLKATPIEELFHLDSTIPLQDDPSIAATRRKQARLATLHEALGHFSFVRLKLLARAGLIARELADVEPPTCPGCAYGKAHRRLWRYKGIRKYILSRLLPHPVTSSWIN